MPKAKKKDIAQVPAEANAQAAPAQSNAVKPKASAAAMHKHAARKTAKTTEETVSVAPVAAESHAPKAPATRQVTHEDIALLAYSYWEQRGYQGGSPEEDWLRAESELRSLD